MTLPMPQTAALYAVGRGARDRRHAMAKPARPGWSPAPGDWVWIPEMPNTIGTKLATAQVKSIAGTLVLVKGRYQGRELSEIFDVSHLRPTPKPRAKPAPIPTGIVSPAGEPHA